MTGRFKIFTINPGSTSTKIALFENDRKLFYRNVSHDARKLAGFSQIQDQYPYREETILKLLGREKVSLEGTDAFVGNSGGLVGHPGGTYACNELLLHHTRTGYTAKHPNNLAASMADDFAKKYGGRAFVVNSPDLDEFQELARVTGMAEVTRKSKGHSLNQKEVGIRYAAEIGRRYGELNLVIAHIGGGVSVHAHRRGRMIDGSDVINGDSPMAPTRSGVVPAGAIVEMCFSGKYSREEMLKRINKNGGLVDHLGTSDTREVVARMAGGDAYAGLIYDAMAYQIAKSIGACATVLSGEVDAILLTGGISHDPHLTGKVTGMVGYIAPVRIFAGEFEMEAMASGALRVLTGQEPAMEYTGVPVWSGFDKTGGGPPE